MGFLFGKKSKDVETDLNRSFYEKQVGITKGSKLVAVYGAISIDDGQLKLWKKLDKTLLVSSPIEEVTVSLSLSLVKRGVKVIINNEEYIVETADMSRTKVAGFNSTESLSSLIKGNPSDKKLIEILHYFGAKVVD